jgi:hypothetical protein
MLVYPVHQVVTVRSLVDLDCRVSNTILLQAADQLENEVQQETVVRTVYLADQAQLDFQVETVNRVSVVNQVGIVH